MFVLAVDIRGIFGATEALLLTILVDAPQVVHTIVDGLLVRVTGGQSGCDAKECNVLEFQLENGYGTSNTQSGLH